MVPCFSLTGLLCVVARVLPGYGVFSQAGVVLVMSVCIVGVAVSSKQDWGEPPRTEV